MTRTGTTAPVARLRLVAANGRRIDRNTRELHILDIENGVGHGEVTQADAASLRSDYRAVVRPQADAQFVAATSSSTGMVEAALGWGAGPRWMHEDGPDGADQCLLDELRHPKTAQRFTHIVLLSGDHIFTDVVGELVRQGVHVTVVSRPSSLNYGLRQSASNVIYLPEPPAVPAAKVA